MLLLLVETPVARTLMCNATLGF